MGAVTGEDLRNVLQRQIEQTVYELVTWTRGTFHFELDELRPIDDVGIYPGDIIPHIDLNTQMVLLEATRIFDERNRGDGGVAAALTDGSPLASENGGSSRPVVSGHELPTGAERRHGETAGATALALARRGNTVVAVARRRERLEEVVEACRTHAPACEAL